MDNLYSFDHQYSLAYNSDYLNIDWQIELNNTIVSDKDSKSLDFKDIPYLNNNMKKVIVTGGAGFIGNNLISLLGIEIIKFIQLMIIVLVK